MSLDDFREMFNLIDSLIMSLNKRKDGGKIKSISVVYLNCTNKENIEFLLSHPVVKNVLNVSDRIKFSDSKVKNIKYSFWENNTEYFYENTKDSFIIEENSELSLEKTYSFLRSYSDFYPVVIMFTKNNLNKKDIAKIGYMTKIINLEDFLKGVLCIIKEIKDFSSYTIKDFDSIKEKGEAPSMGSNIFRKKGEGMEVPLNISRPLQKSPVKSPVKEKKDTLNIFSSLPVPKSDQKLNKYNFPTSKIWLQGFYEYLKEIMVLIIPKDRLFLIEKILTNQTLKDYWIPCFTHNSANPNPGKNYELVEATGDSLYNYCFKFYLSQREPDISESRITNLTQKYASKDFQQEISKAMKLSEWSIIF